MMFALALACLSSIRDDELRQLVPAAHNAKCIAQAGPLKVIEAFNAGWETNRLYVWDSSRSSSKPRFTFEEGEVARCMFSQSKSGYVLHLLLRRSLVTFVLGKRGEKQKFLTAGHFAAQYPADITVGPDFSVVFSNEEGADEYDDASEIGAPGRKRQYFLWTNQSLKWTKLGPL